MYGYSSYPYSTTAQAYAAQYQAATSSGTPYYGQTDSYYSAFGTTPVSQQQSTSFGAYGTPVQPPPPPPPTQASAISVSASAATTGAVFETQVGQTRSGNDQSTKGWKGQRSDQRGKQNRGRNQGGNRNEGYGRFVKGGTLNTPSAEKQAREKAEKQAQRAKAKAAKEAEEAAEAAAKAAEEYKEQQRLLEMFPDESTEDKGEYYCLICRHECNDDRGYRNHIKSMIHTQRCLEAEKLPEERRQKLGLEIVSEDSESRKGESRGGQTPQISAAVVDGGFSQGPKIEDLAKAAQIRCEVCNCDMTGPKAYEAHMSGIRHKKNLKNREAGVPITKGKSSKVAKPKPRMSVVSEQIRSYKDPLVGLEFITEHQKNDLYVEPRYSCGLCESKCDPRTLFSHVTGLKHRMSYMKMYYPDYQAQIKRAGTKKSDQAPVAEEYCRIVEMEIGRGAIKVEMELDPFYDPHQEMRAMKRPGDPYGGQRPGDPYGDFHNKQMKMDQYNQYYTSQYDYGNSGSYPAEAGGGYYDGSNYYGEGSGYDTSYAGQQNYGQQNYDATNTSETQSNSSMQEKKVEFEKETEKIGGLLKSLSKSMVNNEDEAEMALTISKALTNALLSYRTKQKVTEEVPSHMEVEEITSKPAPQAPQAATSTATSTATSASTDAYGSWQAY